MDWRWSFLVFVIFYTFIAIDCSLLPTDISYIERGEKPKWTNINRMQKQLHAEPVGNTAIFRCAVEGSPIPSMIWFKDGHIIKNDSRIGSFKYKSNGQTIVLESVLTADGGTYMCKASNKYGSINYTYQLDVQERTASSPIPAEILQNQTSYLGNDVAFRCRWYSDDHPHIQWIKSWKVGNKNRLSYIKVGVEVLHLKNVSFQDAGEYICLAGNSNGISHQSAWLTVLPGLLDTPTVRPFLELGILISKRVYVGSDVKFRCFVVNDPNPILKWVRRVQPIGNVNPDEDNSYDLFLKDGVDTTKEEMEVLHLENVSYEDSGEYSCVFENSFGVLRQSACLIVLPAPVTAASSLSIVNN